MKDYHINIFYSKEDGGYIADIPDLAKRPRRLSGKLELPKQPGLRQPALKANQFQNLCTGQ